MKKLLLALALCAAPFAARAQTPFVARSFTTGPTGLQLDQFFWGGLWVEGPTTYQFTLAEFDGSGLVGSPLWQQSFAGPSSASDVHSYDVGIFLPAATRYALAIFYEGPAGQGYMGQVPCDPMDGAFINENGVYERNPCADIIGFGLNTPGRLSSAPEPASFVLMASGLSGLLLVGRRRIRTSVS